MNIKALLAGLLFIVGLGQAQATLLEGKELRFTYYFPDISQAYDYADNGVVTVGSGVEVANVLSFIGLFPIAQLDISDTNLLLSFAPLPDEYASFLPAENAFPVASFNGFLIHDAHNLVNAFTSVTINSQSNLAGFDASRISFDDDHIWVNWQGLLYIPGSTLLSLDINSNSQPISEPGTIALLGLGLLSTVFMRRR